MRKRATVTAADDESQKSKKSTRRKVLGDDDDDEARPNSTIKSSGDRKTNSSSAGKEEFLERLADRFAKRQAPARLTAFIHDRRLDVSSRIYNEVVVRMPIEGVCEDLVLGFARSFGPVEYLRGTGKSQKERMEKSFGAVSPKDDLGAKNVVPIHSDAAENKSSSGDEYCHYLQFREPRDAIRCVLELNGFTINPEEENDEQTKAVQAVQQQLSTLRSQAQIENEGVTESAEESALWDELDAAIKEREARPRFVPADQDAKLIVVTCDFFRCAFLENMGGVARASMAQGNPPRRALIGKNASSVDPVRAQQNWLHCESRELLNIYGLVMSHSIAWDDFMFAVNYFSFFFDHRAPPARKLLKQDAQGALWSPWSVVLESLRHVQYRTTSFLKWLDVCSTEQELISGAKVHLIGQPAVVQAQAMLNRQGVAGGGSRGRGILWSMSTESILLCALSGCVFVLLFLLYFK